MLANAVSDLKYYGKYRTETCSFCHADLAGPETLA